MTDHHENSLQTAVRWGGNAVVAASAAYVAYDLLCDKGTTLTMAGVKQKEAEDFNLYQSIVDANELSVKWDTHTSSLGSLDETYQYAVSIASSQWRMIVLKADEFIGKRRWVSKERQQEIMDIHQNAQRRLKVWSSIVDKRCDETLKEAQDYAVSKGYVTRAEASGIVPIASTFDKIGYVLLRLAVANLVITAVVVGIYHAFRMLLGIE